MCSVFYPCIIICHLLLLLLHCAIRHDWVSLVCFIQVIDDYSPNKSSHCWPHWSTLTISPDSVWWPFTVRLHHFIITYCTWSSSSSSHWLWSSSTSSLLQTIVIINRPLKLLSSASPALKKPSESCQTGANASFISHNITVTWWRLWLDQVSVTTPHPHLFIRCYETWPGPAAIHCWHAITHTHTHTRDDGKLSGPNSRVTSKSTTL